MQDSSQNLVLALELYCLEKYCQEHLLQVLEKLFPGGRTGRGGLYKFREYYFCTEASTRHQAGDFVYAPDGAEPDESFYYDGAICPKTPDYWRGAERCIRGHGSIAMYAHSKGVAYQKAACLVAKELGLPESLEYLAQLTNRAPEDFIETVDELRFDSLAEHAVLGKLVPTANMRLVVYRSESGRHHYGAVLFRYGGMDFSFPVSVWLGSNGRQMLQWEFPCISRVFDLPLFSERPHDKVLVVPDEHSCIHVLENYGGIIGTYVVTTWLGGFGSLIDRTDWSPLNEREVHILVRFSESGYRTAKRLHDALVQSGAKKVSFLSNKPVQELGAEVTNEALVKVLYRGCVQNSVIDFAEFAAEANTYFGIRFKRKTYLRALKLNEFLALSSADAEWVLPGLIRSKDRLLIYAAKGQGKTWLATILYLCIAAGRSFPDLHRKVGDGSRVLLIDGEDSKAELEGRIRALAAGLKIPLDSVSDKIRIVSAAADGQVIHIGKEGFWSGLQQDLGWADALVLDNLNALWPESLQSNAEASAELNSFLNRVALQGKAVIVINHASRSNKSFGSSTKEFGMETTIALKAINGEFTSFKAEFTARWRHALPPMIFRLVPEGDELKVVIEGGVDNVRSRQAHDEDRLQLGTVAENAAFLLAASESEATDTLSGEELVVLDLRKQGCSFREIEKLTAEQEKAGQGQVIKKSRADRIAKSLKERGLLIDED